MGYFSRLDLAPKGWDTMDMGGILCGLSLYQAIFPPDFCGSLCCNALSVDHSHISNIMDWWYLRRYIQGIVEILFVNRAWASYPKLVAKWLPSIARWLPSGCQVTTKWSPIGCKLVSLTVPDRRDDKKDKEQYIPTKTNKCTSFAMPKLKGATEQERLAGKSEIRDLRT